MNLKRRCGGECRAINKQGSRVNGPSDSEDVVFNVVLPIDFGHVEGEFFPVRLAQRLTQIPDVLVVEFPFFRREVLQTRRRLRQFVLYPQHSESKHR